MSDQPKNRAFPRKEWFDLQPSRCMWEDGPWNKEPDRVQWEHVGLPCLLIRNDLGAWCGYVGVYIESLLFGVTDIEIPSAHWDVNSFESSIYNDRLWLESPPPVDAPIDLDNIEEAIENHVRVSLRVWFFGFDCCHAGDLAPGMYAMYRQIKQMNGHIFAGERNVTYKDYAYVTRTCEQMAAEIREIEQRLRNKARGLEIP